MPLTIDLNADLGEGVTDDAGLLQVVTSANVACGFHAGDEATMRQVCEMAVRRGVTIGAQVSYRDREGFGRRAMDVPASLLTEWVAEQVETLRRIAVDAGTSVAYLKPHGALYNRVVEDAEQAQAVLVGGGSLPVLTLPVGELRALALSQGRLVRAEGFPDRGYAPDGRLLPRSEPGALIEETRQIAERAVDLARAGVDSVCVHGDSARAVEAVSRVREALTAAGFSLASGWTVG